MRKISEDTNINAINKLVEKIKFGIESALINYSFLFNENEFLKLKGCYEILNTGNYNLISYIEELLKPIIYKCWEYEYINGSNYISWLKDDNIKDRSLIFATFSKDMSDSFCDSKIGIKYEITEDGFIGACEKDGATIIEDKKDSIYTIGYIDGKTINSYNFSTPIITPKQVFDKSNNKYMSKHNEIVINSKFAKPIGIICLSSTYNEMANNLSEYYNVPIEYEKSK